MTDNIKKRILCVDYGDVRSGLAASDPTGTLAVGIGTFEAAGTRALITHITETAHRLGATLIVVGNPINMNGTTGERSQKAAAFARRLGEESGLETVLFDERCTTMAAHRILNETDTRGKKRKKAIDTLSAQIILQNYMDSRKRARGDRNDTNTAE